MMELCRLFVCPSVKYKAVQHQHLNSKRQYEDLYSPEFNSNTSWLANWRASLSHLQNHMYTHVNKISLLVLKIEGKAGKV